MRSIHPIPSRALIPVVAAALIAAGACATNPATGKKQLSLISEPQEIALGQENDQKIVAQMGLYDDAELQAYVDRIGQELAAASERPDLPWTFRVIDDPVVNAFALPGGFIYVTRGILAHMSSEAELATVLGHEIGHVTARHSVNQMSKQQLLGIGLVAGMVAAPEAAQYADLLQTGLGLLTLKFSRDDERQADELGLRYMLRTEYDPYEMPKVFNMLGRVSAAASEGGRIPGWLATHPDPGSREQAATQAVLDLGVEPGGYTVGRPEFLATIDGMVYGPNPREGFFREQRFLHPELEFEVTFPAGWQTANQKQRVIAVNGDQNAILQLTLSEESAPQAALSAFMNQEGIRPGRTWGDPINGLAAASGAFSAELQSQSGSQTVLGRISFVSHGDNVYQLLAYGLESPFRAQDDAIVTAVGSFQQLTDRNALNAQPHRIDIDQLDRAATLAQVSPTDSVVSTEVLALINGVTPSETLPQGFLVKRVTGEEW